VIFRYKGIFYFRIHELRWRKCHLAFVVVISCNTHSVHSWCYTFCGWNVKILVTSVSLYSLVSVIQNVLHWCIEPVDGSKTSNGRKGLSFGFTDGARSILSRRIPHLDPLMNPILTAVTRQSARLAIRSGHAARILHAVKFSEQ
jgi:hypothetical protein